MKRTVAVRDRDGGGGVPEEVEEAGEGPEHKRAKEGDGDADSVLELSCEDFSASSAVVSTSKELDHACALLPLPWPDAASASACVRPMFASDEVSWLWFAAQGTSADRIPSLHPACTCTSMPLPVLHADLMVDPVVSKCGHDFCRFCLDQVCDAARKRYHQPSCPVCRTALTSRGSSSAELGE